MASASVQVNPAMPGSVRSQGGMADFALAEEFLPVYDVSDAVATVAGADREMAWRALLDVDLLKLGREAPLVGMLGALRMLPEIIGHLLHGERPARPPESMRLRDLPSIPMYEGGWILLGERAGHEIALGLVGKFWRPVIEFARIASADEFRDFAEPGFAKTVTQRAEASRRRLPRLAHDPSPPDSSNRLRAPQMPRSCRRPIAPTNGVIALIAPRGRTSHDQRIRVPGGTDSNVRAPSVTIMEERVTDASRRGRSKPVNSTSIGIVPPIAFSSV
jgi:hypothetical protein